jgi:hypothetical protein
MGRLWRRASQAVDRLLILCRSPSSEPILVKTRSVKDLIRGSLGLIEGDDVIGFQPYADFFADRVIVMARHQR